MKRLNIFLAEKDKKDKKMTALLHDIKELSLNVEDLIAEDCDLRPIANVPDNYGIKLVRSGSMIRRRLMTSKSS